ncbi:MAG: hypothetical protein PHR05_06245, partial [Bacteroidales bacterium]|nr:hypothetical protein [Bacteroidales bacterium]
IFGMGVLVIPVLGFLHLGSVLVFNIRGHRWIGGTLFFLWLASLIGLVITSAQGCSHFQRDARFEESVPMELTSDTLYIELNAGSDFLFERYWLEADNSHYRLGWIEGERHEVSVVAFPPVTIVRQSENETPSVWVRSRSFGRSEHSAELAAEALKPTFKINGNVLAINAFQADRNSPWKGNTGSLRLYVPTDQVVIVRKPVFHEFGVSHRRKVNIIRSE